VPDIAMVCDSSLMTITTSSPAIAVIIPYFQRTRGPLRRCVSSILRQDCSDGVRVLIVDDESPIDPEQEIAGLEVNRNFSIEIIKRRNGGPGAARNNGLNALTNEQYIAFLDSDDEWEENYLSSQKYLIDHGYDYVLGNFYDTDFPDNIRSVRSFFGDKAEWTAIENIDYAEELKTPLRKLSMIGPICQTGYVMVSRSFLGETRFDEDLRPCGEDSLFGARLAAKNPRVASSKRITGKIGRGVNVYRSLTWNSRGGLNCNISKLEANIRARYILSFDDDCKYRLDRNIKDIKKTILLILFSMARRLEFHPILLAKYTKKYLSSLFLLKR
jgi:succinoglycan biosynthesis protein ExoW